MRIPHSERCLTNKLYTDEMLGNVKDEDKNMEMMYGRFADDFSPFLAQATQHDQVWSLDQGGAVIVRLTLKVP